MAEVHWTLRDTREDRNCSVPVGVTSQHVRCPRGVSRLHAPEVHSNSSLCSGWEEIEVDTDGTFEEGPVCIMDSRD